MDYDQDSPDCEEGTEASCSTEDERKGLVLVSLGMLLVRSSLEGDTVCSHLDKHSMRKYYASEDYYLLNLN